MIEQIEIPLNVFEVRDGRSKKGLVRLVKMTLNQWINVHGRNHGRIIANKYKHMIENRIKPIVEQAMVDGLEVEYPAHFHFDWYFADKRIDLDNFAFVHKFIFDAFKDVSVKGQEFMPDDSLKYVTGLEDTFCGIDKLNPHVIVKVSMG
jgi:hypothetical protein